MAVERANNFIVNQEDNWMLIDMKANACVITDNGKTNAENLYDEI